MTAMLSKEARPDYIAYFSMEVGLDSTMPTYSGGLGILAGDTLRAAADLGLSMIGITLLHRKGIFASASIAPVIKPRAPPLGTSNKHWSRWCRAYSCPYQARPSWFAPGALLSAACLVMLCRYISSTPALTKIIPGNRA